MTQDSGMNFDEVVTLLGEFGTYQKRVYFLLCLPAITGCMQTLITVFTMGIPDHRCAIPDLTNDTYATQNSYHSVLVNSSIPFGDSCHIIVDPKSGVNNWDNDVNESSVIAYNNPVAADSVNGSHVQICSRYVFDKSVFESTIVTEMGLVCEHQYGRTVAQMALMFGTMLGTIVIQPPADIFGRKKMLMIALFLHAISSLAITWSTYFPLVCVFMFINGGAVIGGFSNAFVIGMELVGPSKRVWTGYVMEIFWSLGMILLTPIAYFLRDWQHLQIATSIIPFAFLSYFWFIPESPRWLLSKGRVAEAEAIIRHAAKVNKVTLPPKMLEATNQTVKKQDSVLSMFRHPVLIFRCLVIFYNWMVSSLAFYGLGLNVGSLGGSVYINFLLSGVMEFLAYVFCMCLVDRVGRRPLNCGLMLLAGVACTLTILPVLYASSSLQWTTVALAMVGKLGIAGGFASIWVFSSELFPTVMRNSGMGASSFCARIGSVISPYIANLSTTIGGDAGKAAPLLIFGLSSILAGLLLLTLPETHSRRLPETLEDAIDFGRKPGEDSDQNGYSIAIQDEPLVGDAEEKL